MGKKKNKKDKKADPEKAIEENEDLQEEEMKTTEGEIVEEKKPESENVEKTPEEIE